MRKAAEYSIYASIVLLTLGTIVAFRKCLRQHYDFDFSEKTPKEENIPNKPKKKGYWEKRIIIVLISLAMLHSYCLYCTKRIGKPIQAVTDSALFPESYGLRSDVWVDLPPGKISRDWAREISARARRWGVVAFQAFDADFAAAMRGKVESMVQVRGNSANIRRPERRKITEFRVSEFEEELKHIARRLEAVIQELFSKDAVLLELTSISSFPGSEAQGIHRDIPLYENNVEVHSMFITLQNVTREMGPTILCPGSHRRVDRRWEKAYANKNLHPMECFTASFPAGSVYFYSNHLYHAGSGNSADIPRYNFQLSWSIPKNSGKLLPYGMTYVMDIKDRGRFCLGNLIDRTATCEHVWLAYDITRAELMHGILAVYQRCFESRLYRLKWICVWSALVFVLMEAIQMFFHYSNRCFRIFVLGKHPALKQD